MVRILLGYNITLWLTSIISMDLLMKRDILEGSNQSKNLNLNKIMS